MSDWIGFFVSIAILLYLLLRNKPAKEPQTDTLKEFLKGLNEDMAAKKKPAPPPPKVVKQKVFLPPKAPEHAKQGIVSTYFEKGAHYEVIGKEEPSRAHKMLQTLQDKRDMVILREIIGPPKCKRR